MQVNQHWKKSSKNKTLNYNSVSREIAINPIDPEPFSQEDTRPEEIADSPWGTDVCFHHYRTRESPAGRQTEADWCAMGRWRVNREFLWKSSPRNVGFSHGPLYCRGTLYEGASEDVVDAEIFAEGFAFDKTPRGVRTITASTNADREGSRSFRRSWTKFILDGTPDNANYTLHSPTLDIYKFLKVLHI